MGKLRLKRPEVMGWSKVMPRVRDKAHVTCGISWVPSNAASTCPHFKAISLPQQELALLLRPQLYLLCGKEIVYWVSVPSVTSPWIPHRVLSCL